jgi:predicted secreted acid phosphatase
VECVRHLHRSGVTIVYLTGRKADSMGAATVQSLSSFGFPVLTDTAILMMKPDSNETDVDYKARCFKAIARLGTVMLTADNEPENVNRFIKEWPDAVNLLLETNCNPDRQVPLRDQAVRMPDFIGLADTPPFTDR